MVDQPGSGAVPQTETSTGSSRSFGAGTGKSSRERGLRQALWARWKRDPGRPLPPIRPWPRRQWPLLVVLSGIFVSLITVIVVDFRPGTLLFALSVLLAATFRLVLTTRRAGLLVLRSRTTDVVTLTVMGVVALLLAIAVPDIR
jgi:hypothetical protein